NVQPHSGAQANAAVYAALMAPGDTMMGLELAHGGHLTHGMKINVSGRLYQIVAYHVDPDTSVIDMDEVQRLAHERRPAVILAASEPFRERQERTLAGAKAVAAELLGAGGGVSVLTGGTDVHLVLCDLRESELDGKQAEDRLAAVGITVNRNAVPFDPRPPAVSSGLRIGTPALATRGLQVDDFVEVGRIMAGALVAETFEARRAAL